MGCGRCADGGVLLYSRRRQRPILQLSLFRIRTFRLALIGSFLVRATAGTVPFLLPLLLELSFGLSAMRAGLIVFTSSLGAMLTRLVTTRPLRRFGFRTVLVGNGLLMAAGIAGMSAFSPSTAHWCILLYLLVFGLIRSSQYILTVSLAYADVEQEVISQATAVERMVQQLSQGLGIAVCAAALSVTVGATGVHLPRAQMDHVFLAVAAVSLLSMVAFVSLHRDDAADVAGSEA